jgi:phenylacetate-CoA ligase
MRRIARIRGRTDDMLIIRGVNVYPSQIEVELLKIPELAPHYQIEVVRQGNTKGLRVHVESRGQLASDLADEFASQAERHIKENVGITVDVSVEPPDSVVRSLGKAQRVVGNTA